MTDCSICGRPMLVPGETYADADLVACAAGHVAMVSADAEDGPDVGEADHASEWVLRMVHAFPDHGRKHDVRVIARAVRALEELAREASAEADTRADRGRGTGTRWAGEDQDRPVWCSACFGSGKRPGA